jgi:hypothetical protein
MSFEVEQSLSRRTIVRTGTKLAYAAPIVAATAKLSARAAHALSPQSCGTGSTCSSFGRGSCSTDCVCGSDVDGGTTCISLRIPVRGLFTCTTGSDCESGEACIMDTCRGTVCANVCGEASGMSMGGESLFG